MYMWLRNKSEKLVDRICECSFCLFFCDISNLFIIYDFPTKGSEFPGDTFTTMHWPCTQTKTNRYWKVTSYSSPPPTIYSPPVSLLLFSLHYLQKKIFWLRIPVLLLFIAGDFSRRVLVHHHLIRNPSQLSFKFKNFVT